MQSACLFSRGHRRKERTAGHQSHYDHALRGAEQLERRELLSITPDNVADVLAHSAEHYAFQIDDVYQQYLGRTADAAGQQFWVAAMQQGMTQEDLEADFIGSAEYIADHGGQGAGWVTGMYENLLGRTPDSSGLSYWVDSLKSGANPVSVALGFAASSEREAMQVTSDYQDLLGRAPTATEVDDWVSAFENGVTNDDVVAGFVGSSEFLQQHGGNLLQFIDAAYQQLLGRCPNSSELEYWYDILHPPTTTDSTAAANLTIAAPANTTAGTAFTVTVTATDASGNIATGFTGTVNFGSTDNQAGLPCCYTFTAADAGVHTFTLTLKTAGTKTIGVNDRQDHLEGYASVDVTPATVSNLTIYEKAATVGVAHYVYVIAKDAYGNTATSYDGTVHFTSSDSQAVLPADGALTNGMGYFSVTMNSPGPQTITVTDTSDSSLTTTANVSYAPPPTPTATFQISGPTSATAGTADSYTVSVVDSHGNELTNFTGTVTFRSTDNQACLPCSYTFTAADAGVHTFSLTLKTAGSQTISASDTQDHVLGYASVMVAPAAVSTLTIYEHAATVGVSHLVYVIAKDAYGNTATSYDGTVHFSSSDNQAVLPADGAVTNGMGYFSVTMNSPGPQTITVTDTSDSSLTTTANVSYAPTPPPAPAATLQISGPTSATAGTAQSYTVSVVDAHGNVMTNFTGTVRFGSTDVQAVLPDDYTFTGTDAGVHTFTVTLKTAGTEKVSAYDTQDQIAGYASVSVAPAAASALTIYEHAATVGVAHLVYVIAKDAYGNTATSYDGTVHFTSSDSQAVLPADGALTNGLAYFYVTMKSPGPQTLIVTDTSDSSLTTTVNVQYSS